MTTKERLDLIERILIEIGDELRARCDYRWFALGDLLDELKKGREV